MRLRKPLQAQRRRGAALVEMAFVAIVFLMLLFGVLEYCRFLFYKQLISAASREGARYAVVNTVAANIETDTLGKVAAVMNNIDKKMKNYSAKVYKADSSGNYAGAPGAAEFGEYLAVEISFDYEPILPTFLFMNKTIKLSAKAVMYSEAN